MKQTENTRLYLVKEGEISLKGLNRGFFEKRLKDNIKDKLRPYASSTERQKGRVFLRVDDACPREQAEKALSTTFGIVSWAEAVSCKKDLEAIKDKAREILREADADPKGTFKVEARREDKSFPVRSYDLACALAGVVNEVFPEMTVDLKKPGFTLKVEIRDRAYLYAGEKPGCKGLPAGTAGRGLLLLSGGIDSPVAAYETAKRGVKLDFLYFHAYPYTSDEALGKVRTLASMVAPYSGGSRLFVVPFTDGQLRIKKYAPEDETTLMFRASMMKLSSKLAGEQNLECVVTGEALAQVASQTLQAMAFTDSMAEKLVLRPLVGFDKEEIIQIARKIGTYETSILPYEDCCVIFSPKHPVTRPDKAEATAHYEALGMEEEIEKAIQDADVWRYDANGNEVGQYKYAEVRGKLNK